MDVAQLVQQKLTELGLEQRDLANAAEVTESYISQLLSRKKMPPAPERTDIYDKLGRCLKLPAGKLAGLADLQRKQELKKKILSPPVPLFREVRELLLEKCKRDKRRQVRAIVEKEPFGELERLITQKLLDRTRGHHACRPRCYVLWLATSIRARIEYESAAIRFQR